MTVLIVFHATAASAVLATGLLALRAPKRRRSPHSRLGETYFWLLAVALGTGMVVGLRDPAISPFEVATPPTFLMGLAGYVLAKRRPRRLFGESWVVWHVSAQGGSFIGVCTATLFQIVPRLAPDTVLVSALIWAVPTIVGTFLIARTTARFGAPATA